MINNEFLNRAIGGIDDELIADAKFAAVKRRPAVLMRIVPIAAAVAILVSGVIAVFSMANRNKPTVPGADEPIVVPPVVDTEPATENTTTEENPTVTEPDRTNTIVDGAFELMESGGGSNVLPAYGHTGGINVTLYSYYLKSEKIYIKVGYGFYNDEFAKLLSVGEATQEAFEKNPYLLLHKYLNEMTNYDPTFWCIARVTGADYYDHYEKVLINGSSSAYFRTFKEDDGIPYMGSALKILEKYDEESQKTYTVGTYQYNYSEVIELDFSNLSVGEHGTMTFRFGWRESGQEIIDSTGRALSYYVGENGIGFSFKSVAQAKANAEKIENSASHDESETEEISFEKDVFGVD